MRANVVQASGLHHKPQHTQKQVGRAPSPVRASTAPAPATLKALTDTLPTPQALHLALVGQECPTYVPRYKRHKRSQSCASLDKTAPATNDNALPAEAEAHEPLAQSRPDTAVPAMSRAPAKNEDTDRVTSGFASLGIPEVVLLGRYHYSRARAPLRPHVHPNMIEVCLLESGAQTYVVNATRYDLTGGDVFITLPDEIHGTGEEPESRGRLYWLEFKALRPGQSFLGLSPRESTILLQRFLKLRSRHFRGGERLAATFERILSACADHQNPLQKAEVRNLLLRQVLDIIHVAEQQDARPYGIGIQRAIREIETRIAWPTLPQLAQAAGMSPSYFKVTFKQETGLSPIEYAMWRRIEKAKQLLRTSGQPITRIAVELGFKTSQHFATVFKRLTSLSPKAFRQCTH